MFVVPQNMSGAEYKALQEAWVTGQTGGSVSELASLMAIGPAAIAFQRALSAVLRRETFLIDFITVVRHLIIIIILVSIRNTIDPRGRIFGGSLLEVRGRGPRA